jgi:hypothetical protein
MSTVPRPTALVIRCPRCAGPLERFDGDGDHETYCPDCVSWAPVPEAPPRPAVKPDPTAPAGIPHTWYNAVTAGGSYVESDQDAERLIRICRDEIMGPDCEEDLYITLGPRIVAVIRGDTGAVVRLR